MKEGTEVLVAVGGYGTINEVINAMMFSKKKIPLGIIPSGGAETVTINTKEWNYEGEVMSVCMANGKYYGSGLCITPEAVIDDRLA